MEPPRIRNDKNDVLFEVEATGEVILCSTESIEEARECYDSYEVGPGMWKYLSAEFVVHGEYRPDLAVGLAYEGME